MSAILVVGGMAVGLGVAAIGTWYFTNKVGGIPYEYASARIRFRQGRLVSKSHLEELSDAKSISEIIAYLEGHQMYNKIMTDVRRNFKEDKAIYETLRLKALQDLHILHLISPTESKVLIEQYAKKYEIENIKNALRVKALGLNEELSSEVYASLNEGQVKEMFAVDSPEAIVGLLSGTEYGMSLEKGMKAYRDSSSLVGFEAALDHHYLKNLAKATEKVRNNDRVRELVNVYISCIDLKVLFRAINEKVPTEEINQFIIPNMFLTSETLKGAGEDVIGTIDRLSPRWRKALEPIKNEFTKTGDLSVIERRLDQYLQELARRTMGLDYAGPGVLLGYLMRTENELRNLRTITSAKEAGMPSEKIKELLI